MSVPGVVRMSDVPGLGAARIASCAVAVAVAGGWAFWPLGSTEPRRLPAQPDATDPSQDWSQPELRIAAFSAPLWVAPPAPPPPPQPEPKPPAPPPPKLQLLAVVNQDGVYEAVLFDPEADKLYTVRQGESLGSRTVERVSATGVDLRDTAGVRTLALRDKGAKP